MNFQTRINIKLSPVAFLFVHERCFRDGLRHTMAEAKLYHRRRTIQCSHSYGGRKGKRGLLCLTMRFSALPPSKSHADSGYGVLLDELDDKCVSRSLLTDEDFSEFDLSPQDPGELPIHTIDDFDCLEEVLDCMSMPDTAPGQVINGEAPQDGGFLDRNVRSVSPLPDVEDDIGMHQETFCPTPKLEELQRDYQNTVQRLFQSMQRTDESRVFIVKKRQKLNYENGERCFFGDPNLHELEHSRQTIKQLLRQESSESLIVP